VTGPIGRPRRGVRSGSGQRPVSGG